MQIHRDAVEVVIQTPAKLNLFFEVLGKRSDGYHEIETLMCPISWYDTLCFRETSSEDLELECQRGSAVGGSDGFEEVPRDGGISSCERWTWFAGRRERTRCAAAADQADSHRCGIGRWFQRRGRGFGGREPGLETWPVRARVGLHGGGTGQRRAVFPPPWSGGLPWSRRADRTGAGLGLMNFVVVRPPEGLATAAVYAVCRPAASPRPLEPLLAALRQGNVRQVGGLLFNRLQAAAEELSPWIARLGRLFAGEDCLGHGMSGSGTAYFGLFRSALQARRVVRRLLAREVGCVVAVRSCC